MTRLQEQENVGIVGQTKNTADDTKNIKEDRLLDWRNVEPE